MSTGSNLKIELDVNNSNFFKVFSIIYNYVQELSFAKSKKNLLFSIQYAFITFSNIIIIYQFYFNWISFTPRAL